MVGGSNPSAPATSSEMTNSKMNKLTHIQQQFLQSLNIQTLQPRPELFSSQNVADSSELSSNPLELLRSEQSLPKQEKIAADESQLQVAIEQSLILAKAQVSSEQLLQDIQQAFPDGINLTIWQDPQLHNEFMLTDDKFFIRDLQVLRQIQVKRQLWNWLAKHFDHTHSSL
jgi:hypothetical protein